MRIFFYTYIFSKQIKLNFFFHLIFHTNDIYKKEWLFETEYDSIIKDKKFFFKKYDVNFSKSNVKLDTCKVYVIETEIKNTKVVYQVENCKNTANFKRID